MTRRAWLAAAAATSLFAIAIAVSGGLVLSAGGVRVSARSPRAAALIAAVLATGWLAAALRAQSLHHDLSWLSRAAERRSGELLLAMALVSGAVSWAFASRSPSGADASGYLSQAAMWAQLEWRVPDVLRAAADWPLAPGDTAPLGWRPALTAGWQVPTYPPGLPLLMAAPFALGGDNAASLVVALAAALAVLATGALARALAGGGAGLIAASLLATSPTFLYHGLQPMSDVPVTAAWAAAFWAVAARRPGFAGVITAVAVLVRPNLAPLAAIPLLYVVWSAPAGRRVALSLRFSLPVALSAGLIAGLQWLWYGSPVVSGYGSAGELFTRANVVPNARLYGSWLWQAEPALVLAAGLVAAGGLVHRVTHSAAPETRIADAALSVTLVLFASGVVVAYLSYAVFERWTYLRFLLPAMAAAAVLVATLGGRLLTRVPAERRGLVAALVVVAIGAGGCTMARRLGVFQVAALTARAVEAGRQLSAILPRNAVLIAGEQSGSMRHQTGRPVIRWEPLDAERLRLALAALRARQLDPWWVLDQWEESIVRGRFAGVPDAALDWPPQVEGGPLMRTRAWRVLDRTVDEIR